MPASSRLIISGEQLFSRCIQVTVLDLGRIEIYDIGIKPVTGNLALTMPTYVIGSLRGSRLQARAVRRSRKQRYIEASVTL